MPTDTIIQRLAEDGWEIAGFTLLACLIVIGGFSALVYWLERLDREKKQQDKLARAMETAKRRDAHWTDQLRN